ncbi:MAG TPA: RraA family protein [Anaerolineae bacterium]
MNNKTLDKRFSSLSTPLIADACLRLRLPLRPAPPGIRSLISGSHFAGRARPVTHVGSVDIFLEAMEEVEAGDVLVIDNQGRRDEGCIGDLTVLEGQAAGLAGMVVWGCHRDTAELLQIALPVYSYGACPVGPTRLEPRLSNALKSAYVGEIHVGRGDFVLADADGVLFVTETRIEEVIDMAESIWQIERRQAAEVRAGKTLRQQLHFQEYLAKRDGDPTYTFRQHLRAIGGAIEE